MLKLLASQAAISLENTRLYRDLEEREKALRRSETYLSEAQRLSQTGSFGWDVSRQQNLLVARKPIASSSTTARLNLRWNLLLHRTHPEDRDMVRKTDRSRFQ